MGVGIWRNAAIALLGMYIFVIRRKFCISIWIYSLKIAPIEVPKGVQEAQKVGCFCGGKEIC